MARRFLTNLDLGTNELQNAVIQNLPAASQPLGVKGRVYFDSTYNVLKVYNGVSWQPVAVGGEAASAITLSGDVSGTANVSGGAFSVTTTVSEEVIQDIVGTMVSSNSESGIAVTYDDSSGKLDFNVNDPIITLSGDVTGSATITNLGDTTITATVVDDSHNHSSSTVTDFVEAAQDAAASMITGASHSGVSVSYNDGSNSLAITNTGVTSVSAGTGVSVSSSTGSVTIGNTGVTQISGTANEIEVSASTGSIIVGLPNDVTVGGDLIVTGNITVNGNTTTLNTATLSVEDNIVTLNSNVTETPVANAGIEVERGTSTNASILWDESTDTWKVGLSGSETAVSLLGHSHVSTDITDWAEAVQDVVGAFVAGSNSVSVSYNDVSNSLTVDTTLASTSYLTKTSGLAVDKSSLGTALVSDGFAKKYVANVGDGTLTELPVTHNMNTKDVMVNVYDNSAPYDTVEVEVQRNSVNQIKLIFASAPTSNQYRVVVVG